MHFTVSWNISAKEPRWSEINGQLYDCFKDNQHEHVVSTYYMVKVTSAIHYNTIHACLLKIAQDTTERIHFIVSPLLNVKGYKGYLPKDKWEKINQITS